MLRLRVVSSFREQRERESEREKGIQTTSVHQFSAPIFLLITNYIYKFDYFLLLLFRLREVFE